MEGSIGKMKTLQYYFALLILTCPMFVISFFVQLRLLALGTCVFYWLIYMGLSVNINNEGNHNSFLIIREDPK